MIEIVVKAKGRGRYQGYVDGEPIGRSSGQPFYHGARALIAMGTDPEIPLQMRHENSQTISMRSTVGRAAKLMVQEDKNRGPTVRAWRPAPGQRE